MRGIFVRAWIASMAVGLAGSIPSVAEADPVTVSDSERTDDLVYFGMFGGVTFGSLPKLSHALDDGGEAVVSHVKAAPAPVLGYEVAYWPFDFFGLDFDVEGSGLILDTPKSHFDSAPGYPLRTVPYEGATLDFTPTIRFALPLYVVQPNVGGGVFLPMTFLGTEDPKRRDGTIAFDSGVAARAVGGINVYVSRAVRVYADYRFDYEFATGVPNDPLDVRGLLRHSIVAGFIVSPESFRKTPKADRAGLIFPELAIPGGMNLLFFIVHAALGKNP